MSRLWRYFLPGYVWALPLTLFGLVLALYYRPARFYWADGCVEMVLPRNRYLIGGKGVGGQTFGNVIFYRDRYARAWAPLRVHERCHTVQGMLLGVFFVPAYVLPFLFRLLVLRIGYDASYRNGWAERQAYGAGDRMKADPTLRLWGA